MLDEVKWYQPILWEKGIQNKHDYGGNLAVARMVESFWRNLSPRAKEFQLIEHVGHYKFTAVSHDRVFTAKDRALMAMEIFLCILVVPLIIMLIAKSIVRYRNTFAIQPTPLDQPAQEPLHPRPESMKPADPKKEPAKTATEPTPQTTLTPPETPPSSEITPVQVLPPLQSQPEIRSTRIEQAPSPQGKPSSLDILKRIAPNYRPPTLLESSAKPSRFSWKQEIATYEEIIKKILSGNDLGAVKVLMEKVFAFSSLELGAFASIYIEMTTSQEVFHYLCLKMSRIELSNNEISTLLFNTIHRKKERSLYLKILIATCPSMRSHLFNTYSEGLTLLHYAWLYHDKAAIMVLEKELKNNPPVSKSYFELPLHGSGFKVGNSATKKIFFPPKQTPAAMTKCHDDLAARHVLLMHIHHLEPQLPPPSPFWPWEGPLPSIEDAWTYLDKTPNKLNCLNEEGLTLLDEARNHGHNEIAQKLTAAGGKTAHEVGAVV